MLFPFGPAGARTTIRVALAVMVRPAGSLCCPGRHGGLAHPVSLSQPCHQTENDRRLRRDSDHRIVTQAATVTVPGPVPRWGRLQSRHDVTRTVTVGRACDVTVQVPLTHPGIRFMIAGMVAA